LASSRGQGSTVLLHNSIDLFWRSSRSHSHAVEEEAGGVASSLATEGSIARSGEGGAPFDLSSFSSSFSHLANHDTLLLRFSSMLQCLVVLLVPAQVLLCRCRNSDRTTLLEAPTPQVVSEARRSTRREVLRFLRSVRRPSLLYTNDVPLDKDEADPRVRPICCFRRRSTLLEVEVQPITERSWELE